MWHILRKRLDTASSSMGRQALYQAFTNLRTTPGKPIGDYFAELLRIRNEIAGTAETIPDVAFRTHIFNTIPLIFEITGRIMACQPNLTAEQLVDALKEDERLRTLRTNHPETTDAYTASTANANFNNAQSVSDNALIAQRGRCGGRGFGCRRGRGGNRQLDQTENQQRWRTFCETRTHNISRKPKTSTSGTEVIPYQTHQKDLLKRTTAITAERMALSQSGPPKKGHTSLCSAEVLVTRNHSSRTIYSIRSIWVIDLGASYHFRNGRRMFTTFKTTLLLRIKLRDDRVV